MVPAGEENKKPGTNIKRILIEVFSVVFAVLVALGVDEAWEDQENMSIANEMKDRIQAEINRNLEEMEKTHENYTNTFDSFSAILSKDSISIESVDMNLQLAVLTSAAWSTAQILEAVNYMDHDWIINVAESYELQEIYLGSQNQFLETISKVAEMDVEKDIRPIIKTISGRLFVMNSLQSGLIQSYKEVLEISAADSTAEK